MLSVNTKRLNIIVFRILTTSLISNGKMAKAMNVYLSPSDFSLTANAIAIKSFWKASRMQGSGQVSAQGIRSFGVSKVKK